jgi:hypothetical protein
MMPPGLNEGEAKFVRDLRDYLQRNNERFRGKEIFLLRNLTRSKGIGFFDTKAGEAFYPDFILWVIEGDEQRIAFIDPHGLRMVGGGFNNPKIRLHKDLEALSQELSQRHQRPVRLTSFILSTSRYEEVKKAFGTGDHPKEEFYEHHVLFQEDPDYVEGLLRCLMALK